MFGSASSRKSEDFPSATSPAHSKPCFAFQATNGLFVSASISRKHSLRRRDCRSARSRRNPDSETSPRLRELFIALWERLRGTGDAHISPTSYDCTFCSKIRPWYQLPSFYGMRRRNGARRLNPREAFEGRHELISRV